MTFEFITTDSEIQENDRVRFDYLGQEKTGVVDHDALDAPVPHYIVKTDNGDIYFVNPSQITEHNP